MSQSKTFSLEEYKFFASIAADQDLYTTRPHRVEDASDYKPIPARGFLAGGAGNIVVRPIWGDDDASDDVTITVVTGVWYPIQFRLIKGAGGVTTATNILVGW